MVGGSCGGNHALLIIEEEEIRVVVNWCVK